MKIYNLFIKSVEFLKKVFKYGILILSGEIIMKQKSTRKTFQMSKETLQKIISLITMFLSFFVLNSYLQYIAGVSLFKIPKLWIINTFFTISWIFLIIGIIYVFQGIFQRVLYITIFVIFSIISYLESVSFSIAGEFLPFSEMNFTLKEMFQVTNENFILVILISIFLSFVTCYLLKKAVVKKRNFYELSFFLLLIFFYFGVCRFVAYYSMGPRIVYSSGKTSDDWKSIYLKRKDLNQDFKISGLYDFTMKEWTFTILKQVNQTIDYLKD